MVKSIWNEDLGLEQKLFKDLLTYWTICDPLGKIRPFRPIWSIRGLYPQYMQILSDSLLSAHLQLKHGKNYNAVSLFQWRGVMQHFRQFCDDAIFRAPNASLLEKRTPLTKSWAFISLLLYILCGRGSWSRTAIYKNIHLFWLWSVRVTVRLSKMAKIKVGNNGTAIYASGSLSAHNL